MRPRTPHHPPSNAHPGTPTQVAAPTTPLRFDSHTLMAGQRMLEIVHQGEVYRLQTTRFGKLILTK